jgi:multiple sugar transport system ATP-binding protein
MATLSLEQLTKVFENGVEAVRQLDLFVDDGEFVVLVGPSGCGKTTALRMVAGLDEVTSGTIRLDGKVVNDLSPKDRDVAMVFQNYALYPHMNVLQNIAFSLRVRGVGRSEREERARRAVDVLGLSEVALRKPRQLSGGQRQRVAMGRALVREPAVFLMDEPLSNLDAKLRVQMRSEVLRVQRRLGVATLYVTHDQTEAMTMGDRVAVLRHGVLQQFATPRELYDEPANLFVASFMGSPSMNLYEASIADVGGRPGLSLGSQELALPDELARTLGALSANGNGIVVGVRPEHLLIPPPGGRADEGRRLAADVELVEALGNEQLVHFSIDARKVRDESDAAAPGGAGGIAGAALAEGVARVDPRAPVAVGQRIEFAVDVDRLHLFDPKTGSALA